ncbi:MAG: MOSC domain-containing protein, partial [Planctomycetia bacterium]|nr:MOSC domain-containing protein [Planctomycetia bacterium]
RGFSKRFSGHREATLPPWATAARFDHFYRLAVNTRRPGPGAEPGVIRVGDEVEILSVTPSNQPDPIGV